MHSLSVQLPNTGPWSANGRTLARLVSAIQRSPEIVDQRVDAGRIVLIGHSFGASAVAIALGDGAPAVGGVLLDAAGIGQDLPKFLKQIKKPVMLHRGRRARLRDPQPRLFLRVHSRRRG